MLVELVEPLLVPVVELEAVLESVLVEEYSLVELLQKENQKISRKENNEK